jgi:RHS repeat-associated protein
MTTAAIAYGVNVPRQKLDFIYDGEGRRVAKTVSAWNGSAYAFVSQTRFLYDGWNIIAEYRATSATETSLGFQTIQAVHTWGPDLSGTMQGAGGVGGLLSTEVKSTSSICFPAYDGNGNISGWVKSNGTLLSRRDYSPFGQLIVNYKLDSSAAATLANLSFGFSTKFTDSESGLLYYGFRFYDAMNGRWLGRDPSGEQGGVNLYACVGNNTVNGWDYLGLWGRTFRDGRKAWATVCAEQGDDWARLAQRLRLEESEAPKWVRNHDAIPQPGKNYEIPNVVFMSLAKVPAYQWIRPHIMGVIQNDVMDRAVFYKKRGFMILPYIAMDDSEQWKRLWNVQGMYAVLTAAHGTSGSIEPGGDSSGLVSPHQVYPSYKLSEVWILACGSARPTGPKWGTYIVEWKQHVSKSGVFRGYWEDYTFYWNEEKSRRVEPGSP